MIPADPEADVSVQVLSVPRAAVTVRDQERAELKLKNLRNHLESTISRAETRLSDEGRFASSLRRDGCNTEARILMPRRVYTRAKITVADHMLGTVMYMIDGLKQAQDNRRHSRRDS